MLETFFSELNKKVESLNIIIHNRDNLITKDMRNVRVKTKTSNGLNYNGTLQNVYYL